MGTPPYFSVILHGAVWVHLHIFLSFCMEPPCKMTEKYGGVPIQLKYKIMHIHNKRVRNYQNNNNKKKKKTTTKNYMTIP